MTTTVPNMRATIEALHAAHLDCKVMVGGAVLTPDYARDIGADYYCKDAKASADLAKQLLGLIVKSRVSRRNAVFCTIVKFYLCQQITIAGKFQLMYNIRVYCFWTFSFICLF